MITSEKYFTEVLELTMNNSYYCQNCKNRHTAKCHSLDVECVLQDFRYFEEKDLTSYDY